MIDVATALAAEPTSRSFSWTKADIVLYHLGIGAGAISDTATGRHLRYLYERSLVVLPTFATIPATSAILAINELPGVAVDFAQIMHGEHSLRMHRLLPAAADDTHTLTRIADVIDKGKATMVVLESELVDDEGPIATNTFRLLIRGEGGVGRPVAGSRAQARPDRAPDAVVRTPVPENQAALYRLCGDMNPLHIDPEVAAGAGFPAPILHGLCTYGMVCLAVIDALLAGDSSAVRGYDVRFAGVVFPGETLVSSMWRAGNSIRVEVETTERKSLVLSNAAVDLAG